MTRDENDMNEMQYMTNYFFDEMNDELYPMQHYDGQPEFSVFQRDNYNVDNDEDLPSVTFSSNTSLNELPPLPAEHTYIYQDFHYELERWAIFRSLPGLMNFDATMNNFLKGIRSGSI